MKITHLFQLFRLEAEIVVFCKNTKYLYAAHFEDAKVTFHIFTLLKLKPACRIFHHDCVHLFLVESFYKHFGLNIVQEVSKAMSTERRLQRSDY